MDIKPIVGMTVYLRPTIHNHRQEIQEGVLTKIGRKFYTVVSRSHEYRFDISDLLLESEDATMYSLYFSKDELDQAIESDRLYRAITNRFERHIQVKDQLTLDDRRVIARAVGVLPREPSPTNTDNSMPNPAGAADNQDEEARSLRLEGERFDFERLRAHVGHQTEVIIYGEDWNVAVECIDCCEVLCSLNNPNLPTE